jgi:hypothetical protein
MQEKIHPIVPFVSLSFSQNLVFKPNFGKVFKPNFGKGKGKGKGTKFGLKNQILGKSLAR